MKKLFLLVTVLAALTVFCPAAFAQYGYGIPTLRTVLLNKPVLYLS